MTYQVKHQWQFDEFDWIVFDMIDGFIGPVKPKETWTYSKYLNVINGGELT